MSKFSWVSTALTCLGAAGVIGTAVAAAKAQPKAALSINQAEAEKWDRGEKGSLTKLETVKAVLPAYIPTIVTGAATIACIFGANALNKRQQAALMSAYALLDRSYREYTNKIRDTYGDEADARIREEIGRDQEVEVPEGEQLFFDYNSMQYFTASLDDVLQKTVMDDGLECYIISTPFDVIPRY